MSCSSWKTYADWAIEQAQIFGGYLGLVSYSAVIKASTDDFDALTARVEAFISRDRMGIGIIKVGSAT